LTTRVVAVLACCAVLVAGIVAAAPSAHAQTAPRRVLVYGDSLSWEAQAGIEQAIEAALPGWDAVMRTIAGSATCDALPAMRGADGNLNAGVVVLEFVAVPFGPCMSGRDSVAQHTADTQAALALWASRGVPVVLVGAPRGVGEPRDPAGVAPVNRDLAAGAGQTYVDSGVLLRDPWTGVYQQRLPCLDGEGPEEGCGADGLIDVRDETGGHFCAIHDVGPCPVYASGITRFAAAIAAAVARAAGATPPPLPGPPPATALEQTVRSLSTGPGATATTLAGSAKLRAVAQRAVLPAEAVPADFEARPAATATATTAPPALQTRVCRDIRRTLKSVDDVARGEASYAAQGDSARVDQVVHVLPTQQRAREVYGAYRTPRAAKCVSGILGVPVTAEKDDRTTRVGDQSITYRAAAGRNLVVRILRNGRTVTALAFANAVTPPPAEAVAAISNAAVEITDAALLTAPSR
jgi:hypothetical protein